MKRGQIKKKKSHFIRANPRLENPNTGIGTEIIIRGHGRGERIFNIPASPDPSVAGSPIRPLTDKRRAG